MASQLAEAIFAGGPAPPESGPAIAYGTAGFRNKAEILEAVMYRVGVLAALRSASTSKIIGVVVTASHNPEPDNGVKIVDPDGGMLAASWEGLATGFANAKSAAEIDKLLKEIWKDGVPPKGAHKVVVGMDTRASSEKLCDLVKKGVAVCGAECEDLGLATTPQVHFAVMQLNKGLPHTKDDYYDNFAQAFIDFVGKDKAAAMAPLTVDCANGVGSMSLKGLIQALGKAGADVKYTAINFGGAGAGGLNDGCGAEHVQKAKALPAGVDASQAAAKDTRFCSLDGDADRIVFFFVGADKKHVLLDGDKILILLSEYIGKLVKDAGVDLRLGVVQTAYANGASTAYLREKLGEGAMCFAATGVKFLHHKALDFDIGAYFEANGHGTVLFSENAVKVIEEKAKSAGANDACKKLFALTRLINPAIGDALSDMLAVEGVLALNGMSMKDWAKMYEDLPSRMTKELVKDRTLVKTIPDESRVLEPAALQEEVDALVAKVPNGRCFVRPSGTEDCVRVYAEGNTQEAADKLAADVGKAVQKLLA